MKKLNYLLITFMISAGVLLPCRQANAQAPESFNYQAVLRDASGAVRANTSVAIRVSILSGSATGTTVYSENHSKTTNSFGLVNLAIGKGSVVSGSMATIDWSNGTYYVKITVDGTDFGTSQLLSVPYALHAKTSENVVNGLALPYTYGPDPQYVGDEGAFIGFGHEGYSEDFIGYKNNRLYFKDSPGGGDVTDPDVIVGGRIGIGVEDPVEKLEIDGSIDLHNHPVKNLSDPENAQDAATKAYVDANSSSGTGNWKTSGNAGTNPAVDFLGTTDDNPVVFRVNNTSSLILYGQGRLASDNAGNSVFIGKGSGANDDLSDNGNIFIGDSAGYSTTTGFSNVGMGNGALYGNTVQSNIVAVGDSALFNNGRGATETHHGTYNMALGSKALYSNTTGYNNTAVGNESLRSNITGSFNTANGTFALFSNTEGSSNTAYGSEALQNNTTGHYNTAIGGEVLWSNTDGSYNTASGSEALKLNTTGRLNTANGSRALYHNTTGSSNTASGFDALVSNSEGHYNTANGAYALESNTTGEYNTANGAFALCYNTTGSDNTANGVYALESNTTGKLNTSTGSQSMYYNTTGDLNTANGRSALYSNTTGYNNMANGSYALYSNTTGYYNAASGSYALYSNTTGNSNTASGYLALYSNTTGFYNTAIGLVALRYNITGNNNTAVGYLAGPPSGSTSLSNTGAFGSGATVTSSNTIRIGNTAITQIGGQVAWSNLSDGRFKTNVVASVPGLEFILKLRPVTFNWDIQKLDAFTGKNDSVYRNNPELQKAREEKEAIVCTGFIAQDVEEAANACGYDFSGVIKPPNEKTPYNLSYAEFVVPLVKAVQELSRQNEEMKKEIVQLKAILSENH